MTVDKIRIGVLEREVQSLRNQNAVLTTKLMEARNKCRQLKRREVVPHG